jgi:hypothetical protein
VKKSDSEIGPISQIAGLHQQYGDAFVDVPAVNIPSGEPGKSKPSECQLYHSEDANVSPPEVNCLYSVINRRSAVALLPFVFMVGNPRECRIRDGRCWGHYSSATTGERLYCLTQMVIFNTSGVRNAQLTCASLARRARTHFDSVALLFVRALRSLHQTYTRKCLNWRHNVILSSHFLLKTSPA